MFTVPWKKHAVDVKPTGTSVSEPWGVFLFQNIHNTFSVKKRVCFPNHFAFWNSPNVKVFFPGCVTECSRIMVDSLHSVFSSELNTEVDFIKLSWTSTSADFLRSVRPPRNQAWQHNHQQVQAIWRPVEAPRESRESSESVEPCSLQVYSVWMFQRMALILTWWKLLRCMLQQLQQMNIRTFQSRSWFSNEQIGRWWIGKLENWITLHVLVFLMLQWTWIALIPGLESHNKLWHWHLVMEKMGQTRNGHDIPIN